MRINSVPDVKCFNNNKKVLRAQSMLLHFVRHPVITIIIVSVSNLPLECYISMLLLLILLLLLLLLLLSF